MRISDWSSDVCSSDLPRLPRQADEQQREAQARQRPPLPPPGRHPPSSPAYRRKSAKSTCWSFGEAQLSLLPPKKVLNMSPPSSGPSSSVEYTMSFCSMRSEEHTSELQSLMRTSYAVFCLKQKTHSTRIT